MPVDPQADQNTTFWWSLDWGNVHFLMLSFEEDFSPDSPQYHWAQRDLAAVNRSQTPFVIATAGPHAFTVTATNLWGISPAASFSFTVKLAATPVNPRIR